MKTNILSLKTVTLKKAISRAIRSQLRWCTILKRDDGYEVVPEVLSMRLRGAVAIVVEGRFG